MSKALVIIDVQNFYFGEGGLEGAIEASLKVQRVLNYFREKALPIFHIKHVKNKELHPERTEYLEEIHENVRLSGGEIVILKSTPGSFKNTELLQLLRESNVDELIICGMMSHMCVDTTTREAFDLDFKCTVLQDACVTRPLFFDGIEVPAAYVHATSMAALKYAFAKVISCDEYIESMSSL